MQTASVELNANEAAIVLAALHVAAQQAGLEAAPFIIVGDKIKAVKAQLEAGQPAPQEPAEPADQPSTQPKRPMKKAK